MNIKLQKTQSGFALLIFIVILMGIGGLALTGFSQQALKEVEAKKFAHNKRVLEEAKQALLFYAYSYPVFSPNSGPGRLPCPDTDNDGVPDPTAFCKFVATGGVVGRFPWNDANLNFFDALDADGERLWYAVSENFANNPFQIINSDSNGTITIFDQTGSILYDGTTNGVAAVIIASGTPLAGQDRNADPLDPANYLDAFGSFDNSVFVNASKVDADGLRMGPVTDDTTLVINDQMVLITADEVIEMAEKAVLDAYRNALQNYDQRIDTDIGPGEYYPWLFNYAVNNYGAGYPDLNDYPSDPVFYNPDVAINSERELYLVRKGRIPSIFANYFTEIDSQPIESNLGIDLTLVYPATVNFNQALDICPANPAVDCTNGVLDINVASNQLINHTSSEPLKVVKFDDTVFPGDDLGRLSANLELSSFWIPSGDVRFFWDEAPTGDGWRECLDGGDDVDDCNNVAGNNVPGGAHDTDVQVLRVQVDVSPTATVNFDLNYDPLPVVAVSRAADGNGHAEISATLTAANLNVATLPITVNYDYDDEYNGSSFGVESSGTLSLADLLAGSELILTLRYYPELPGWAFENGWHDSILMAYASDYQPDVAGGPCTAPGTCLQINNFASPNNDKISILVIAGQHNWDDGPPPNGLLADDVLDVFDPENANLDDTFDARAPNGNDKIMILDEL